MKISWDVSLDPHGTISVHLLPNPATRSARVPSVGHGSMGWILWNTLKHFLGQIASGNDGFNMV
jgi:hypothetical protein